MTTAHATRGSALLALDEVSFVRNGRRILDGIDWHVASGQRWVVLGANGSGKTTLVRIAALYEHPSTGTVQVLGETLGRTDVRQLRRRVGYSSAAFADQLRPTLTAAEVVETGRYAALEPWWHRYTDEDRRRAQACLERLGVGHLRDRTFGTLSSGERQRVLLARTHVNDPALVLLDEPAAGLDLGGREQLVATLAELAADPAQAPFVLITHHVDEIPQGTTHALLIADGRIVVSGAIDEVLTADALSTCFGLSLTLERRGERWSAWAR